jgi:hypothetical protein
LGEGGFFGLPDLLLTGPFCPGQKRALPRRVVAESAAITLPLKASSMHPSKKIGLIFFRVLVSFFHPHFHVSPVVKFS